MKLRIFVPELPTCSTEMGTSVAELGTSVTEMGTSTAELGISVAELRTFAAERGTSATEFGISATELGRFTMELGTFPMDSAEPCSWFGERAHLGRSGPRLAAHNPRGVHLAPVLVRSSAFRRLGGNPRADRLKAGLRTQRVHYKIITNLFVQKPGVPGLIVTYPM